MVAEDTAQVLEEASEVVEDTLDLIESRVSWIAQNPKSAAIAAGLTGLTVGAVVGAYFASRWLKPQYQKMADEQIEDVKSRYTVPRIMPDEDKPSIAAVLAERAEAEQKQDDIIDGNGYTSYDRVPTTVEAPQTASELVSTTTVTETTEEVVEGVVKHNIFESDDPERFFDMAEEQQRRLNNPTKPCVITKDEFDQNDEEYETSTITYYDGDDVLADSRDEVIPDVERTVGEENLLRFGHGSGDPNVVYIRNNRLEINFEVLHSDGKFAKEVLGFDDGELRHSRSRPDRRFRLSDD